MTTQNELEWIQFAKKPQTIKAFVGPLFWTIVGIIVTVISIGVTVGLSVNAYNHRYDSTAVAAGSIEFSYSSSKQSAAGTLTASAGTLEYGYYQKSGSSNTKYYMTYKKNNDSTYLFLREVTVYANNDYTGSYDILKNNYSQAFDIRIDRKNNASTNSVFYFDWGVR